MGVRRGVKGVAKAPLDFEIFSKKGCLPSFVGEKINFITLVPPWKNVGKIP